MPDPNKSLIYLLDNAEEQAKEPALKGYRLVAARDIIRRRNDVACSASSLDDAAFPRQVNKANQSVNIDRRHARGIDAG
jgi:hypothetical protein